jgi:DNA-directed RNA polymerase specialized sigma24 family protein
MDDPVTLWINQLRDADPRAAQRLWDYYCQRLYAIARKHLPTMTRRVYDEEDAAVSAFHSLCRGIAAQRFPNLDDRDNLWRLLVTITARKVSLRRRYDRRDRRDTGRTVEESIIAASDGVVLGLDGLAAAEPTPEFAAEVAESCELLFARLADRVLQQIAQLKLEGYHNGEIATELGVTRRTIERKLGIIRRLWSSECADSSANESSTVNKMNA